MQISPLPAARPAAVPRRRCSLACALLGAMGLALPLPARAGGEQAVRARADGLFDELEEIESGRAPRDDDGVTAEDDAGETRTEDRDGGAADHRDDVTGRAPVRERAEPGDGPAEATAGPEQPRTMSPEAAGVDDAWTTPGPRPESRYMPEADAETLTELRELVHLAHEREERRHRRAEARLRREERRIERRGRRAGARAEDATPACLDNRAVCHRFGIGLEAHAAMAPAAEHTVTGIGIGGLRLSLTLTRFLAVGVGQLGAGEAPALGGHRWAVNAAPYAELYWFASRSVQLYLEGGATLQRRFGADLRQLDGLAPFAGVGLRFWMGSRFTLSPGLRAYRVVSDAFIMSRRVLPRGSELVTGGLSMDVHF